MRRPSPRGGQRLSYQYNTPGRFRQEEGGFLLAEGAPGAGEFAAPLRRGEERPAAAGNCAEGFTRPPSAPPHLKWFGLVLRRNSRLGRREKAIPLSKLEIRFSGRLARRSRYKGSFWAKEFGFLEKLRFLPATGRGIPREERFFRDLGAASRGEERRTFPKQSRGF